MQLRSSFSVAIADRLKAGSPITNAIIDIIGGIRDGSAPRVSDILDDLTDMGVWQPDVRVARRRKVA